VKKCFNATVYSSSSSDDDEKLKPVLKFFEKRKSEVEREKSREKQERRDGESSSSSSSSDAEAEKRGGKADEIKPVFKDVSHPKRDPGVNAIKLCFILIEK
jgi:hypothetical protein